MAEPVAFTELVDDGRYVRDLDRTLPWGGITELERFATALAAEYARRVRAQTVSDLFAGRRREAHAAADAQHPAGERPAERRSRIRAAEQAVGEPSNADVDAAVETVRAERLQELQAGWATHMAAAAAQRWTVAGLANAWMRNRQEELLFRTETQHRATGQAIMWTNLWIEPEATEELPVESHDPGVSLQAADGGHAGDGGARVDPRIIPYLSALHARFSHVSFGTYMGHGSGGFAGRGLSVDCELGGQDRATHRDYGAQTDRHWWQRENVAELLDDIDAVAGSLGFRYFAIYNDFAVAAHANSTARYGNVGFAANVDARGNLNYHGGGVKLHVHLDLIPLELIAADNPARRGGAHEMSQARREFLMQLRARAGGAAPACRRASRGADSGRAGTTFGPAGHLAVPRSEPPE